MRIYCIFLGTFPRSIFYFTEKQFPVKQKGILLLPFIRNRIPFLSHFLISFTSFFITTSNIMHIIGF